MKVYNKNALSVDVVDCRKCTVHKCKFFADLQEGDPSLAEHPIRAFRYASGSTLYNTGDPGNWVFTVREGLIKLVLHLPDGTQRIVRLLRKEAVTGLETLFDPVYGHTAIILQPTLICRIPVELIRRLDATKPHLHRQIMKFWHKALQDADEWLLKLSTGHARARVARMVLFLLPTSESECDLFNREDVGAILGLSTETSSRTIAEFKREGLIIETGPNRCHCDVDALREAAME